MKSMTDFIMEQEVSTAPVEVFNESTLVSNFMSMHAAAAEVACILEFASIAEFCTENDINMPEQLVQEGFKDTINKIWTAIAKWFEKVADWFKSLIKGTVSACSTSNLKQILAKLKTYPEDTKVKNEDIITNVFMIPVIVKYIEKFREFAIKPMTDNKEYANTKEEQIVDEFIQNIDKYIADLEFIKKRSNWQDANGNSLMTDTATLAKNLQCLNSTELAKVKILNGNKQDKTYADLGMMIEALISLDVPKTGAKILEELDADINGFKALAEQKKEITVKVDNTDTEYDVIKKCKEQISSNPDVQKNIVINRDEVYDTMKDKNIGCYGVNDGDMTVSAWIKVWQTDKEVKNKVTTASNLLATGYDLIKVTLTESLSKEFKDIKAADEKSYKKELKSVEKAENSVSIGGKNNNLPQFT